MTSQYPSSVSSTSRSRPLNAPSAGSQVAATRQCSRRPPTMRANAARLIRVGELRAARRRGPRAPGQFAGCDRDPDRGLEARARADVVEAHERVDDQRRADASPAASGRRRAGGRARSPSPATQPRPRRSPRSSHSSASGSRAIRRAASSRGCKHAVGPAHRCRPAPPAAALVPRDQPLDDLGRAPAGRRARPGYSTRHARSAPAIRHTRSSSRRPASTRRCRTSTTRPSAIAVDRPPLLERDRDRPPEVDPGLGRDQIGGERALGRQARELRLGAVDQPEARDRRARPARARPRCTRRARSRAAAARRRRSGSRETASRPPGSRATSSVPGARRPRRPSGSSIAKAGWSWRMAHQNGFRSGM